MTLFFFGMGYLNTIYNEAAVTKHIVNGVLGLLYGSYILLIYIIK